MSRVITVVLLALGSLLPAGAVALADKEPPNVAPHRHFLIQENGSEVQTGPRVCDDKSRQHAFNQYHSNVHVSNDGLSDDHGPRIVRRACAYQG